MFTDAANEVIDLSQDQAIPAGSNTASSLYQAGKLRPFASTASAGCLNDNSHLQATVALRRTDAGLNPQEMQVVNGDGVWAPKAPRVQTVRMGLGFMAVSTNMPDACSEDLQRREYLLPPSSLTNLQSLDSGMPLIDTEDGGAGWHFITREPLTNDSLGRISLKLMGIPAIYCEIQCIARSLVLDIGAGSGSRVYFGRWVPETKLRNFLDLLTISGDSPGLAFDGYDHTNVMQDAPRLTYFADINELLRMLTDLRALVAKKVEDWPFTKGTLIKQGALPIVGDPFALTALDESSDFCGSSIFARFHDSNNFTLGAGWNHLPSTCHPGSMRTVLGSYNISELTLFALLLGGEAPVRQLLALFTQAVHDYPATQTAVQEHAMEVNRFKPALAELWARWRGGAHSTDPASLFTWLGMKTQTVPEIPGVNAPTTTMLMADLLRTCGVMGASYIAVIQECKQHLIDTCIFMVTSKRVSSLMPPLPGASFPCMNVNFLLLSELKALLQAAGYSDNPTGKFALLERIDEIQRICMFSDLAPSLFRWPHKSISIAPIDYSDISKCRWLNRWTCIYEIVHLRGGYGDISIGRPGSGDYDMWCSIRGAYDGREVAGCPITLDVPGNKLERGDGTFAFNLSFQHRLSQPVLAKTLHSLYARRLAEGWGRNLQEAISTGFTDYTLRTPAEIQTQGHWTAARAYFSDPYG